MKSKTKGCGFLVDIKPHAIGLGLCIPLFCGDIFNKELIICEFCKNNIKRYI